MDLGRSWASFGRGLGRSWDSSGRSWATFSRILELQNPTLFKHGADMGAKKPFGLILGASWKDLGQVSGGFGDKFGRICTLFCTLWALSGNIWKNVALLGQSF